MLVPTNVNAHQGLQVQFVNLVSRSSSETELSQKYSSHPSSHDPQDMSDITSGT